MLSINGTVWKTNRQAAQCGEQTGKWHSVENKPASGTVWRTNRRGYLLCRWEEHLAGFPHLGVADRWPATPKRARISAVIASS